MADIRKGASRVESIRRGATYVTRVYKGENLVWERPANAWYFNSGPEGWYDVDWSANKFIMASATGGQVMTSPTDIIPGYMYKVKFRISFSNGGGGCSSVSISIGTTPVVIDISGVGTSGDWVEFEAEVSAHFTGLQSMSFAFTGCGGDYSIYLDSVVLHKI